MKNFDKFNSISKTGKVTITSEGVQIEGFEFNTKDDLRAAGQVVLYAILELQNHLDDLRKEWVDKAHKRD